MAEFTAHAPGTPSWVDLMSPDVEGSKVFYTTLFGWDAEDQLDEDGNRVYVMFRLGGKAVAGLGQSSPGMEDMPAMWTTYISTDDVEATVARVEAAGGSVMMPFMQVFESGQMAVLADPTGAAFSIWKAGDHIGAEIGNVANTMSWNELMTRDVDAALPFYAAVFGWTYDAMDMGPMGTYNLIKGGTDDEGLGGIISMPPGVPDQAPNHWGVYFTVDDIAAAVQTVTGSGGTVVQEPFEVPGIGTQAVVHDPQHGAFSLMQPGG